MKYSVKFDGAKCKGCGLCAAACPRKIIRLDMKIINRQGYHPMEMTDASRCTGCASCALMCPDGAIGIFGEEEAL